MKFVEIPKCENLFPCGVFLFIAFICVILLFSNAYGESINVIGLGNFTVPENLSKSTKNYTLVDNVINSNITNQLTEKFVAQIKQIDEKKALIEVIPVSIERSLKNDSESPKSNLLYSDRNDTVKSTNTTEVLPPPPMVSYIENEGEQLKTINYVSKNSNINTSEEEDDESSRNTSEEEDDESSRNTSEEEDDESSRNTSEEEDDESSRNTSEEEDDESSRNTSEEEDDESSRNTSEEEDDESSRNTSEEEDDESSRNTSEEEDDESSRNTSEEEDDESSRNTSEEEDDESSRNTSEEEDDESSRNTSEEEDDESSRNTSEEEDDESSRNTSEEEDDESSRNTSEEEDDESSRNTSEEEDDESSRNTSEEEDDESSRNTSEEEDDESSRNTSEEEDDESSRNTSEEEDDESSRNTSEESTGEIYYKKPNVLSTNELTGNKIIGNSIDNENNKLMSQFSELNSSIISNNQINAEEENSKINDKKPIANAGLDQVIKGDQNIVLDASSSFDPEGKISSYLWKQTGNSEDNINTSHSMIYSFPIPEGLEENILEFKLIVMDENGQKDIDTVKYLITDEYNDETET